MKKTLDLDLACGPAIPLLEKYVHTKMWTQMFPAALVIIAEKERPPKYPLRDEQMNKTQSHPYSGVLLSPEQG